MSRHVVLAGATGLVGGHLLQMLLDDHDVADVVALTRRPLAIPHPKLVPAVVDFDHLEHCALPDVDDCFLCLGTTIRAAGSQDAFAAIDLNLPLTIARMALAAGASRCFLVSAMGASPQSRVFYRRIKGELEVALAALPFRTVVVFRPSLLAGERTQHRPGERLALTLLRPIAALMPARYRPVPAIAVARAMMEAAHRDEVGRFVVESDALQQSAHRRST
ncbi:MAG: NAD(P)H-binding protein [Betaproteobacteria bacterium]